MAASPLVLRSRVLTRAVSSSLRRSLLLDSRSPALLPTSRRASCIQRLPLVCGGLLSVLPLHSAIASARLRSVISPESQSWGLIPQGNSMPL